MHFHGKPAVGRCDAHKSTRHPVEFAYELCLFGETPDMLDYCARVHHIERILGEGQGLAVCEQESHAREFLLEEARIIHPRRGQFVLVRVPRLEVV